VHSQHDYADRVQKHPDEPAHTERRTRYATCVVPIFAMRYLKFPIEEKG